MILTKLFEFYILFILVRSSISKFNKISSDDCPLSCTCQFNITTLTINSCTRRQVVKRLPNNFKKYKNLENVKILIASHNFIQGISNYLFENYTNLEKLILNSNEINEIPIGVFDNLFKLNSVNLSYNSIQLINSKTFQNLTNLLKLHLGQNQISNIHKDAFAGLKNLVHLNIYGNNLTSIAENIFTDLENLEGLFLHSNSITDLAEDLFKDLKKLKTLSIHTNKIKSLKNSTFRGLYKLESLASAMNEIEEIDSGTFADLISLKFLYLQKNQIKLLRSNFLFKNLVRLEKIYLEKNNISVIPRGLFDEHLINLSFIKLSYNLLSEIELWPLLLPNIEKIDISFNNISKFTNKFNWLFLNSSSISRINKTIDLSNNFIDAFDDQVIQQYGVCNSKQYELFIGSYLNGFLLANNPIDCDCNTSMRLISETRILLKNRFSLRGSNIFKSKCSNSPFDGKSILEFSDCAEYPLKNFECLNTTKVITVKGKSK